MLDRRSFLVRTGLALGTGVLAAGCRPRLELVRGEAAADLQDWRAVRGEFNLSRDYIHLTGFLLTSHPRPVREAIETHRRGLDENPANYLHDHAQRLEADVLGAAAEYLGVDPTEIALTDSTTMGLGLLYGGLKLREGQDILTTHHDHYSTATALRLRAERTGASVRAVSLYENPTTATEEEITEAVVRALKPRTRVVAVTWFTPAPESSSRSAGSLMPWPRSTPSGTTATARCCASTAFMESVWTTRPWRTSAATSSLPARTSGCSAPAVRGWCGVSRSRGLPPLP